MPDAYTETKKAFLMKYEVAKAIVRDLKYFQFQELLEPVSFSCKVNATSAAFLACI